VEGALNAVADHLAAVADVGTQVLAVRFQNMQLTRLVTVSDQVLTEVAEGPDLADRELG
jgi:hypothetical protein